MGWRNRIVLLLVGAVLSACGSSAQSSMPVAINACRLSTRGAQLVNEAGAALILRGPDLPSILGMERAGQSPDRVLEDAVRAGAGVVRVAVVDAEFTPTYVPLKLLPLAKKADALGIVLILSWRNDPSAKLDKQADDAEDFLRLAVPALRAYDGVWIDPFHDELTAPDARRRAVAVRMIDIVRGLGDDRIMVINNAEWLLASDADTRARAPHSNVLYGVRSLQNWNRDDVPLFYLGDDAAPAAVVQLTGGGDPEGAAVLQHWPVSGRCK
ncbi:MAG: hypothetical protein NTZ50_08355 [Chloroflexi bacterium]|nr:hypothetical protein [Chloroflexota bacterium]